MGTSHESAPLFRSKTVYGIVNYQYKMNNPVLRGGICRPYLAGTNRFVPPLADVAPLAVRVYADLKQLFTTEPVLFFKQFCQLFQGGSISPILLILPVKKVYWSSRRTPLMVCRLSLSIDREGYRPFLAFYFRYDLVYVVAYYLRQFALFCCYRGV